MTPEPRAARSGRVWFALVSLVCSVAHADSQSAPRTTLDLRTVIGAARRNPPAILAAARSAEARRDELAAAEHAYLPSVSLLGRADYDHGRQESLGLSTHGGSANLHGELSANVNVVDFGRRAHDAEAAEHAATAAREHLYALQLTAASSAGELYLRVLADERLKQVFSETMAERSDLLTAVQALVDRGLRPAVDVVRTQAEIGRARMDVAMQQERIASDREALAAAMGLNRTTDLIVTLSSEAELSVEDDPQRAAARALPIDPALGEARAQQAEADARKARAKSELYPQLELHGSAGVDRSSPLYGTMPSVSGLNATLGALASWTIIDASAWDRAAAAASDAASAAATLAQTALDRRLEIVQTAYEVRAARAQLVQAEQLLSAFTLTVQAERERYVLGEASLLEVMTALDSLQSARSSQIAASFAHDSARIKLKLLVEGGAAFER
jgi:outer membrane protein TolC